MAKDRAPERASSTTVDLTGEPVGRVASETADARPAGRGRVRLGDAFAGTDRAAGLRSVPPPPPRVVTLPAGPIGDVADPTGVSRPGEERTGLPVAQPEAATEVEAAASEFPRQLTLRLPAELGPVIAKARAKDLDLTNALLVLRAVARNREVLAKGPTARDLPEIPSGAEEDPLLAGMMPRRKPQPTLNMNMTGLTPRSLGALDDLVSQGGWSSRNALCVAALVRDLLPTR